MNNNEIKNGKVKIFLKWKNLREMILKEKILIDVLFKNKNNDNDNIKKLICDLEEIKLKIRKINNKTKNSEVDNNNNYEEKIEYLSQNNLLNKEIENFLFFLRSNIDYILTLIFSINNEDKENHEINSLIELITNNLYNGFPKEKSKNKQLMIILYKLLEKEICKMNYALSDDFIKSNYFLDKFLDVFLSKNEFIKYLDKILTSLLDSIDKEIEEKNICNLSLIEIKNNINISNNEQYSKRRKSLKENNINSNFPDMKNIYKNELIYYIWKNHEQFFNDLTQEKLFKRINIEKNNEIKNIILNNVLIRNISINNGEKSDYSNESFIKILNTNYFDKNLELIVKEYKSNYLFIHQKIDGFLLDLIGKIKLIPNIIRYICKIIYILISAKFPDLPRYLKNSFIGKFFFEKYLFPCLLFENKFLFNNKIISFQARKCIGEIISILYHANNCLLFDNINNAEKTVFNNYIIEIIPVLNEFYDSCINIKLPEIIEELINLKIEEIKIDKLRKKNFRKRNKSSGIINLKKNYIYEFIKLKRPKSKISMKSKYICFSIKNLLYILSLIEKNKNNFLNLPKYKYFNNLFQSIFDKKADIENLISDNNKEKYYIIFQNPKYNYIKLFRNMKKYNIKLFLQERNISNETNLKHIKYCLKVLLQKLNFYNTSISNEQLIEHLIYLSHINNKYYCDNENQKNVIKLFWFAKYLNDNLQLLEEKYIKNDYEELFNELYEDEFYNLNLLNKYFEKIIVRNKEKNNSLERYIIKFNSLFNYTKNAFNLYLAEKIIFIINHEAYITLNIKNTKIKNENIPQITLENAKTNNEKEIKISKIEDFVNLFSKNCNLFNNDNIINPYKLLLLDIIKGENENNIYSIVLKYFSIIRKNVKNTYKNFSKNEINEIMDIIKDYIIESIYKLVFPKKQSEKDINFFNLTRTLDWVTKEHFGINNIELYQSNYPEKIIDKLEESKSLNEKINYIKCIYKYINSIYKFNTGKEDEIGQDEATPVLQYIIIKSQPKKLISNINFLKIFISEEEVMGDKGFYISQIESAIDFILSINHTHLNMEEELFNANIKNSKTKLKIK